MFEPPDGTAAPTATFTGSDTGGANAAATAAGAASTEADLDDASGAARERLDQLRRRFVRGQLPPLGHLIVRHRLVVPGGFEAPWVLVTSWPAPAWLLGRCLNDTSHPELAHIRMGRTVAVGVDDVIDWAVLDAGGEIAEGGWSRGLRHAADLPDLPDQPDSPISTGPSATRPRLTTW
ncbi:hypothetical protein [Pseudofrankia asymbiotica]|uniref:DUF2314 domain-containing protein n=1 Tax=Pseudofrankia asymbiotica TaxID=1834516 RepID=A0A1V2HZK5_9ACTN|nr:hypothetical protein [Pseudofrankia asymbiotica]ONH22085.1 hypothetical protein BL253_36770 [Pseudofrankia asymbiotica]